VGRSGWIVLGLVVATSAVYLQVRDHQLLAYDDPKSITENPMVQGPVGLETVLEAFRAPVLGNWIPLTQLSYLGDAALHGASPRGVLLVNLALHTLAAVVCFLAFARMTRRAWESAFVAAVFALHPLHVESVAWASERKDVLSGLCFMLCLLAHARYAERPGIGRGALVFAALALGLLAKPMLVTLPFVLLLLDYWPLARLTAPGRAWPDAARARRAFLEKLPLFALVAVASAVTLGTQSASEAVFPPEILTLGVRVKNALVAYGAYLVDAFWPAGLAVFYPHPLQRVSGQAVFVSLLALGGITFVALRQAVARPWLGVGWLWYLGTLVPVIGLVQVGTQARADRYTYLPLVGISLMVAFTGGEIAGRSRTAQRAVAGIAGAALAGLAAACWIQVGHWRDTETLFAHAVAVTRGNYLAHNELGLALLLKGEPERAASHFRRAIRLMPGWSRPRVGLAEALARSGSSEAAVAQYEATVADDPDDVFARGLLGIALVEAGRYAEARPHLERALTLEPPAALSGRVHAALGRALAAEGDAQAGLRHLETALALLPEDAPLHYAAAVAAERAGQPVRAVRLYRSVLRLAPERHEVGNNLAWLLATCAEDDVRDPGEALRRIEATLAAVDGSAALLDTRAAALAASGRVAEAAQVAEQARDAALREGEEALAAEIDAHRALYAAGRPLRVPCAAH
jgi:tetratricopeptide (TPR) repeat protein